MGFVTKELTMKKLIAFLVVGGGLLAMQGCADVQAPEDVATADSPVAAACFNDHGKNVTKAALAVALALDLGRWNALADLHTITANWSTYVAQNCSNCPRVKAVLGQQYFTTDQSVFDATDFRSDLAASFARQANMDADIARNRPWLMPPAHKLTKVAGPVDLGAGACGAHWVFQADHLDGTPLTATEARNLQERLCYFGMSSQTFGTCGNGNPWIAYVSGVSQGCPTGRTCVAIDPTYEDGGTTSTTQPGAIPTYSLNRVWDPANTLLGTKCLTTTGYYGTMKSMCSSIPSTCGFLYCVKN
jgi:hypothetical protein